MGDNTKLEPHPTPSISQPASNSPVHVSFLPQQARDLITQYDNIPLKLKEPPVGPNEKGHKPFSAAPALPTCTADKQDGYDKACVNCEVRRTGVGLLDEETGGSTLKRWEAHRLTSSTPGQSSSDTVIYTPESTAEALAYPPTRTKRRRKNRTEEERINYLRADPYVAQFEAYRVLCASCNKWIRLRPNSTYCSSPWEIHIKSCLVKKAKNVHSVEAQKVMFSKDPDIRKFNAERILCNICDKWMSLNPDDHQQAVLTWLQHRAACQKNSTFTLPLNQPTFPRPSRNDHPADLTVDSTAQSPTVAVEVPIPTYYSVTHGENPHRPTFTNAYTAQGMGGSSLPAANYHVPLYSHSTFTSTYNPELQTFFRSNVHADHLGDMAVDGTAQSPTMTVEVPPSFYYVTYNENTNWPIFTNTYTARGIGESGLVANYLMPVSSVGSSYTLTTTHDPELQILRNNVQSPTMAVGVPTYDANYYLAPGENTNM